jgi:hypothetical protein
MNELYGRPISRDSLKRRVGHMSQIAGARACVLASGAARGVEAVDVKTGSGFEFTVLPGRGLDIAWASYRGVPLGYISKTGVVSPAFFEERGASGFLRNFFAGLMTTAGLSNIGVPSAVDGAEFGLHGRISNVPAEDVAISQQWVGDEYRIVVAGTVRQASAFGECLVLRREIATGLGANSLIVRDTVENASVRPEPLALLYHCNFGYPIVSGASRLYATRGGVDPRDAKAAAGLAQHREFGDPQPGYVEECFYHRPETKHARAYAAVFNEELGLGAFVRYRTDTLPLLVEWKMLGEQEYVVGLEPGTSLLDGRSELLRRGEAPILAPGETRSFEVEIGVVENRAALEALA